MYFLNKWHWKCGLFCRRRLPNPYCTLECVICMDCSSHAAKTTGVPHTRFHEPGRLKPTWLLKSAFYWFLMNVPLHFVYFFWYALCSVGFWIWRCRLQNTSTNKPIIVKQNTSKHLWQICANSRSRTNQTNYVKHIGWKSKTCRNPRNGYRTPSLWRIFKNLYNAFEQSWQTAYTLWFCRTKFLEAIGIRRTHRFN